MTQDLPTPDYVNNMKLIGYSDQGGRPDGVQVMVNKGHAIVGHSSRYHRYGATGLAICAGIARDAH